MAFSKQRPSKSRSKRRRIKNAIRSAAKKIKRAARAACNPPQPQPAHTGGDAANRRRTLMSIIKTRHRRALYRALTQTAIAVTAMAVLLLGSGIAGTALGYISGLIR